MSKSRRHACDLGSRRVLAPLLPPPLLGRVSLASARIGSEVFSCGVAGGARRATPLVLLVVPLVVGDASASPSVETATPSVENNLDCGAGR